MAEKEFKSTAEIEAEFNARLAEHPETAGSTVVGLRRTDDIGNWVYAGAGGKGTQNLHLEIVESIGRDLRHRYLAKAD